MNKLVKEDAERKLRLVIISHVQRLSVVQVDLEEGVRMLSRLVEHDAATLRIGMPVEAVLVPADDGVNVVPCFRPAETADEPT